MKTFIKLIIAFTSVFFLNQCSDEINSPLDDFKYYTISGMVKDSSSAKKNALILLDSDSTLSGDDGGFTFTKISAGKHTIRVLVPDYETYFDTITVQSDTSIFVNLKRIIKYYSVTGIVFDVLSDEFSPIVRKDIPVYLDDDSTISGEDGRFYFNNIIEGKHYIRISLPIYEPYVDTIILPKDNNLVLYIHGIKEDYFPLVENTQKLFQYRFSSANVVYVIVDEGTALWKIGTKSIDNTDTVYNVLETLIYTRTINGLPSPTPDTLVSQFQIIENSSKKITILSSFLNGISFNRYMDPRLEQDGLIPKSFQQMSSNITIYLKRNIGFFKITESGFRWGKIYELLQ